MRVLLFLFSVLFSLSPSLGHTIIAKPSPRENNVHTNASPFECGSQRGYNAGSTYTRGQVVDFQWGRNNHYGGFVQASVLPAAQANADIYSTAVRNAFDDPANIVHVSCYNQQSCRACNGCSDNFYGLGGDGTDFQQNMCNTKMTIPSYLPDGEYVMKIVVFGNGDSFGVRNMAHSSYSNCHNFRIAGGAQTTKAANNRHIEWGAGNAGLYDHGITLMNQNKGLNIPQGQCGFMATNTHMGCVPIPNVRAPACSGPIPELTRCGRSAAADTRAECLGFNKEDQVQGGDLYNHILGVPPYHPNYNGQFTLISHRNGGSIRAIALPGAGGNTGGGNTGGGNTGGGNTGGGNTNTGTCEANGNCRSNPGCCAAGQMCYEKDQFYAGCYAINTCVPGVHTGDPAEYQTPWSCLLLTTTPPATFGIYWKNDLARVVDVANAINANGNQVWMWENYGPGVAQRFEWINGEQIRWMGTDKCLDVNGGNAVDGTQIIIWPCNAANPNQKFALIGDIIQWKSNPRFCLDVSGGSSNVGTPLQIWTCIAGNPNQQFVLQSLIRSGSAFVNTKALSTASSLTPPVKLSLKWVQGVGAIDEKGNVTTFVIVPIKSTVFFNGASSTNIVKRVCPESYEKGGSTNPCDEPTEILPIIDGKVSFSSYEPADFYFIGASASNSNELSINQRVQISFVDALSSTALANALNDNTPAPSSSSSCSSSGISVPMVAGISGAGGALLVGLVAGALFFRSKRQQQNSVEMQSRMFTSPQA